MTPIELPPREVHLTLTALDRELTGAETERFFGFMDPSERARFERFKVEEPRRQFLVTRALIRTELSRYVPVAPEDWRFQTNEHGRPEICGQPAAKWLRFNLSNTRGMVVCALTREADVGVDVEDTGREHATADIGERYFSKAEVQELRSIPLDRQRDRFFDYWTLKESYIKARGMGLAIPLDGFTFHLQDGQPIRIDLDPALWDDNTAWQFWLDRSLPKHRLAVAVRRGSGADFTLRTRWLGLTEI